MAVKSKRVKENAHVVIPGGLNLDWYKLLSDYPDEINFCFLVALDYRKLSVLLDLATNIHWYWLWQVNKDDPAREAIQTFIDELIYCLMSGCKVEDLIITQRLIIGAITGQTVDLDQPLPQSGQVDFSADGLSKQFQYSGKNVARYTSDIGSNLRYSNKGLAQIAQEAKDEQHLDLDEITTVLQGVQVELADIQAAIEGIQTEDLEDDLANVWGKLVEIVTVLGAVSGAPVPPL